MSDLPLSLEQWREVVDHSPEMILVLDESKKIRYVNYTMRDYAREDLLGISVFSFVPSRFHEMMRNTYDRVLATGEHASYDVEYESQDGNVYWYSTRVGKLQLKNIGQWLILCVHDITDFKNVQDAHAQQKNVFSAVIDSMVDGVAVIDEQGKLLVFNAAAEKITGRQPQEATPGKLAHYMGLYHTNKTTPFRDDEIPLRRAANGEKLRNLEVFIKNAAHPSGRYMSVNASPLTDSRGRRRGGVAVFRDVTEAREATENLKSEQQLLRKLLDVLESDRKLVSHEIHDGLTQEIVGAQMHLESAIHGLPENAEASLQLLQQASRMLKSAIGEARRMINGLRPLIIDEQGVVAAIQHLIAGQEEEAGLEIIFTYDDNIERLDPRIEETVFRIVQESLSNVSRHGRVSSATIVLRRQNDSLNLQICDGGIGFDPGRVASNRFGLRGIRERARLLGGHAVVESHPGKGTSIQVNIPLKPPR